jgi:hypothetical protein
MNAWMKHLKSVRLENPNASLKEAMQMAKKTYNKAKSTAKYAVTGKKQKGGKSKTMKKKAAKKSRKPRKSHKVKKSRKSRK